MSIQRRQTQRRGVVYDVRLRTPVGSGRHPHLRHQEAGTALRGRGAITHRQRHLGGPTSCFDHVLGLATFRSRVWLPARRVAGVEWAGFHDLRRASATALVDAGVDVRTTQHRLGHADPRLTLGLFAQVVRASDRDAAETLGAHFARDERAIERDDTDPGPQIPRER